MKLISEEFGFKSFIISCLLLIGYCSIFKGIFEICMSMYRGNFGPWMSNFTNGDIVTIIAAIIGMILILRKRYQKMDPNDEALENRKYQYYRMILVLVVLVATIAYNKAPFQKSIMELETTYFIMTGLVFIIISKLISRIVFKKN